METIVIILNVFVLIGFVGLVFFLVRRQKGPGDQSVLLLQNQMNEVTRTLDAKLGELPNVIQRQFGESAKIIKDVTEKLTKLDETNKS